MKIKASIISLNKEIINAIENSNNYEIIYIYSNQLDYEILSQSELIVIDNNMDNNIFEEIEIFCLENKIKLLIIPNSLNLRKRKIEVIDNICFLELENYQISKLNFILKRIFDVIFSLVFISLSLWLFILIYFVIKIFDPGPALYVQKRLTLGEKEFIIYKFRTMYVGAEKSTGAVFSTEDDLRITKIGKILRKYRLDELPQIFNVLNGSMSLIGPRPERYIFIKKFKELNNYYKFRFNVKAGITGYAQIYARYDSSFEEKLTFDLYYISNYSLLNDFKILIKTIIFTFSKDKSKIYKKKNELKKREEL